MKVVILVSDSLIMLYCGLMVLVAILGALYGVAITKLHNNDEHKESECDDGMCDSCERLVYKGGEGDWKYICKLPETEAFRKSDSIPQYCKYYTPRDFVVSED